MKDHPSLHFNLSHSGDLALIAVGRDAPIGVDIEQVRCIEDADAIAQRFFAPREVDVYMSIPERNRRVPFFNSWTRKEAVAKATGDGLSLALDRIEVSMLPGEPARVLAHGSDPEGALGWTLAHVEPASGFVGAVATRRTAVTLRAWSLDLDRTKLIDG